MMTCTSDQYNNGMNELNALLLSIGLIDATSSLDGSYLHLEQYLKFAH